ncbi:MAG TPA: septum formation protein Maf [Firmicutes bacterium]|nr:septum formation protein Maf [Bacillota bacterium]
MKKKIILASSSPRRIKILRELGIRFKRSSPNIVETQNKGETPRHFAVRCSIDKAKTVAEKKSGIIIAADTIVVLDNKVIGKPKNRKDAVRILKKISGKTHTVITGITVLDTETGRLKSDYEETKVVIAKLTMTEINCYINTYEPLDKAGAYAAQGKGAVLVEKVHGDFFNVVGLPVFKLNKLLKFFNINLI